LAEICRFVTYLWNDSYNYVQVTLNETQAPLSKLLRTFTRPINCENKHYTE